MSTFLGIDIGTTAIKLGVIQENQLLFSSELPLQTYGDDTIKYQKGAELLGVLEQGILAIPAGLRQTISILSFSTAMHSLMPDDAKQSIFLWSDIQGAKVIESFKATPKAEHFYELTGTPIHAMSPFAKILYLKQYYPNDTRWYGIKELVMRYFTGQAVIDYATASATGLFDLKQQQWSPEILDFLGISSNQLANLADTTQQFELLPKIRQRFEFSEQAQVVIGASDGTLAAYASYYHTRRRASLTIGTSAAVRQLTKTIQLDREKQNFCYYLNADFFVSGAPSNNGGCVLEWAQKQLARKPDAFFSELPSVLNETTLGAKGARFFPYLNGERAPYWTNQIKGGFFDVTIQHTNADLIRSVVEGMLLNIRQLVKLVADGAELSVSGGVFKTPALGQLAADIFGTRCYYAAQNEPLFGLYYLIYQPQINLESTSDCFIPEPAHKKAYQQLAIKYFA